MDKQTPTQSQHTKPSEVAKHEREGLLSPLVMDKNADCIQTPTQIASEVMRGCKCSFILDDYPNSAPIEDFKCGNILSTKIEFCDKCRYKILAYRTAWENELEIRCFDEEDFDYRCCECCKLLSDRNEKRISELTSALKILNSEKIE